MASRVWTTSRRAVAVSDAVTSPVSPGTGTQPRPSATSIDAGERGCLEIGPRAVERIAEVTARRHSAVLRQSATFGRGLPKAKAHLAGRRARLQVEIPVSWGYSLVDVASEVRDQVGEGVHALTELGIDAVDVDISVVEVGPTDRAPGNGGPETPATAQHPAEAPPTGDRALGTERPGSAAAEAPSTADRALDDERSGSAAVAAPSTGGRVLGVERSGSAGAAAKRPAALPAAVAVGILAALGVMVVGAVGVRETLVSTGVVSGTSWLEWLFGKAEVLKPVDWMIFAGIAALLVGSWILLATFRPRKATHLAVGEPAAGVWIGRRDAARLAAESARAIDSVTRAKAAAKRRKLRVSATTFGDAERVREELAATVHQRLQAITPTPRVQTRVTVEEP